MRGGRLPEKDREGGVQGGRGRGWEGGVSISLLTYIMFMQCVERNSVYVMCSV